MYSNDKIQVLLLVKSISLKPDLEFLILHVKLPTSSQEKMSWSSIALTLVSSANSSIMQSIRFISDRTKFVSVVGDSSWKERRNTLSCRCVLCTEKRLLNGDIFPHHEEKKNCRINVSKIHSEARSTIHTETLLTAFSLKAVLKY